LEKMKVHQLRNSPNSSLKGTSSRPGQERGGIKSIVETTPKKNQKNTTGRKKKISWSGVWAR